MKLVFWGAAKIQATAPFDPPGPISFIGDDNVTGVTKASTGVYHVTFEREMSPEECCPLVTRWLDPPEQPIANSSNATLNADGVTLTVAFIDKDGAPVDSGFSLIVHRFSP